jgi:hypothetical protein
LLKAPGMNVFLSPSHLLALAVLLPTAGCGGRVVSMGGASPAGDTAPADWTCLGPDAPQNTTKAAAVSPGPLVVAVREAYSGVPVTDAVVSACAAADTACAAPLARASTDAAGTVTLAVPQGVDAPAALLVTASEMPPHWVFLANRAPSADTGVLDVDVYIAPALEAMARLAGVPSDPTTAVVRVDARDCGGAAASGVAVSMGATGGVTPAVAYLDGDGSTTRATSGTDATGIALGFGVPPGEVGVADAIEGQPAGGATAFAHAGAVSMLVVGP